MASTHAMPIAVPANDMPGPAQGRWTYADYAAIPNDGRRYEVVAGVLFMAPAPNFMHQNAVIRIAAQLWHHLDGAKLGKVLTAPLDVRLTPSGTVVQPDVLVVLNEHQRILTDAGVSGAPDLVVEVASPSTATYDRRTKMDAYRDAGVPEYWIADPHAETVELFTLVSGGYASAGVFQGGSTLPSIVVPDFPAVVEAFFA